MKRLNIPISDEEIRDLNIGDTVNLSGIMLTGRDDVHKWMIDTFIEKTKAMEEAQGEAGKAYAIQAETLKSKLTILDNSFQIFSNTLLNKVVPAVTGMMDAGSGAIQWFNKLDESTQDLIIAFTALGVILIKMPAIIRGVTAALRGLQLAAGPAGWLTLALGTLATLWITNQTNAERAAAALEKYRKIASDMGLDELINNLDTINKLIDKQVEKLMVATESGPSLFESLIYTFGTLGQGDAYLAKVRSIMDELDELSAKKLAFSEHVGTSEVYGGVVGGIAGALGGGSGFSANTLDRAAW